MLVYHEFWNMSRKSRLNVNVQGEVSLDFPVGDV